MDTFRLSECPLFKESNKTRIELRKAHISTKHRIDEYQPLKNACIFPKRKEFITYRVTFLCSCTQSFAWIHKKYVCKLILQLASYFTTLNLYIYKVLCVAFSHVLPAQL